MTTHILLIDDHALFRSGISMVLAAGMGDVKISEAESLEQALLLSDDCFDLVLLDHQLGGLNGLDGISLLKRRWPEAKVLMVSAIQDAHIQKEAMDRGAQGFINKAENPARMLELLAQVLAGHLPAPAMPTRSSPSTTATIRLSPRQTEVLELLCLGLPNKLIGRRLHLSENTVRGHVQAILQAMQVSSRSEAAFVARLMGLIS
ncbi:response regulator transcription factor [Ectopseudomonas mendocina]|uniref:Response regulator transcription factor n=1 Tax=Ectopseudomonas mendocina TaxID=300 RepID=A0ABZ2RNE8_ECTME